MDYIPKFDVTDDVIFNKIDLTIHEQTFVRGKPKKYLLYTIDIFNKFTNAKKIIEVGSIRSSMRHSIEDFIPRCCNDGHSTYFWDHYTAADIYTVDISENCKNIITKDERLKRTSATTDDAINFLKQVDFDVDLLFLDAWDVIPGTKYAEKHLEAYQTIRNKLSYRCLVLIDDTDIANGGKGQLVIPALFADGFVQLTSGRQSLFYRS